jgi:hypothetical protein
MLLAWLHDNGATSPSLPDAWLEMLVAQGLPPLTNLITNPELAGGAASGPGNANPPTGWSLNFNTVTSGPESIGDGMFQWRSNPERDNGRSHLSIDLSSLMVPDKRMRFEIRMTNVGYGINSGSRATATIGATNITLLRTSENVQTGQTGICFYEFLPSEGATLQVRAGTGVTTNSDVEWITSHPALYDLEQYEDWDKAGRHRNDLWFRMLGDLGFTGSLNDREHAFWAAGGAFSIYNFNGTDQYAVMPAYNSLGDPARYRTDITFTTNNPDGNIINPLQPITEFSRVFDGQDQNYHSGTLKNLRLRDTSPINGRNYYQCAGTGARVTIPSIFMREGEIQLDFIYNDNRDQWLLGDDVAPILEVISNKLSGGDGVTEVWLDGRLYGATDLVLGRHYRVKVVVTDQMLTRVMGWCGVANLIVTTK